MLDVIFHDVPVVSVPFLWSSRFIDHLAKGNAVGRGKGEPIVAIGVTPLILHSPTIHDPFPDRSLICLDMTVSPLLYAARAC